MRVVRVHGGGDDGYRLHVSELTEAAPIDADFELEGVVDTPTSHLRARLPELLGRVRAVEASDHVERVRERRSALMRDLGAAEAAALYHLDRFLTELTRLREDLEARSRNLTDVDRELAVDEHRPARPLRQHWLRRRTAVGTHRVLDRRAMVQASTGLTRDDLVTTLGEVALLENAIARMHEPAEHHVVIELLRVGRGRRPPSFEEASQGFLEALASVLSGLRGEIVGAAALDEDGRILEDETLAAVCRRAPSLVTVELEGVAIRSLLEGEVGCHVWASVLAGSEIVRVRLVEAGSARAAVEAHLASVAAFDAALDRGDDPLPADPQGLLPAVRRIAFDPPDRPGETALLEVEDYVTGQVLEQRAQRMDEALRTLVWLRASRRPA